MSKKKVIKVARLHYQLHNSPNQGAELLCAMASAFAGQQGIEDVSIAFTFNVKTQTATVGIPFKRDYEAVYAGNMLGLIENEIVNGDTECGGTISHDVVQV